MVFSQKNRESFYQRVLDKFGYVGTPLTEEEKFIAKNFPLWLFEECIAGWICIVMMAILMFIDLLFAGISGLIGLALLEHSVGRYRQIDKRPIGQITRRHRR